MARRIMDCECSPVVRYKLADGTKVEALWADTDVSAIADGAPSRTFPWYLGKRNYSGIYWCATERNHVGYESRLELSRLVMKDFDASVQRIASQPFRLAARIDGIRLTRVPDYLVITDDGPLVVDVKRALPGEPRPEYVAERHLEEYWSTATRCRSASFA